MARLASALVSVSRADCRRAASPDTTSPYECVYVCPPMDIPGDGSVLDVMLFDRRRLVERKIATL